MKTCLGRPGCPERPLLNRQYCRRCRAERVRAQAVQTRQRARLCRPNPAAVIERQLEQAWLMGRPWLRARRLAKEAV